MDITAANPNGKCAVPFHGKILMDITGKMLLKH